MSTNRFTDEMSAMLLHHVPGLDCRGANSGEWELTWADNGPGISDMSAALGFAVGDERPPGSLSRYGIGMKMSAFALGDSLQIVTRRADGATVAAELRRSDFADGRLPTVHIREARDATHDHFDRMTGGASTGTVVRVTQTERRFGLQKPLDVLDGLVHDLGVTYREHLVGGLYIGIARPDGSELAVQPHDPLYRDVVDPRDLRELAIPLESDDGSVHHLRLTTCFLPEDPALIPEWDRPSLETQGLYFVRNGRVIARGRALDGKNCGKHPSRNWIRMEVRYAGGLDVPMGTSYPKDSVQPREDLAAAMRDVWRSAVDAYKETRGSTGAARRSARVAAARGSWLTAGVANRLERALNEPAVQLKLLPGGQQGRQIGVAGRAAEAAAPLVHLCGSGPDLTVVVNVTHPHFCLAPEEARPWLAAREICGAILTSTIGASPCADPNAAVAGALSVLAPILASA